MPGTPQFIGEIPQRQRDSAPVMPGNSWNLRSLGHTAIFTFASLHDMPPDPPLAMSFEPIESLVSAMLLEDQLQLCAIGARNKQTVPAARRFGTAVLQWHAALPLTITERARLVDVQRVQKNISGETLSKALDALPRDTKISGGVRVTSDGPELKQRWQAWREQRDEFAGQGSLIQARHALRQIIELCGLPTDDGDLEWIQRDFAHPAYHIEPI